MGEYQGVVCVSQILPPKAPNAGTLPRSLPPSQDSVRTHPEGKVRRRRLTDDGNVEIPDRELAEKEPRAAEQPVGYHRATS